MEKTQRYLVLSPLKHDSKAYRPGATVELTEFYAGPLLACAVIAGLVPQQPPASIPERNTTTNEESGDSALDGGQEGTAPADEGADASAPSSEAIDKKQRAKK